MPVDAEATQPCVLCRAPSRSGQTPPSRCAIQRCRATTTAAGQQQQQQRGTEQPKRASCRTSSATSRCSSSARTTSSINAASCCPTWTHTPTPCRQPLTWMSSSRLCSTALPPPAMLTLVTSACLSAWPRWWGVETTPAAAWSASCMSLMPGDALVSTWLQRA